MGKIIIKANINMKPKELEDLYKFIYDQYKNRDIILVPFYCDVYVVDGKPELKWEAKDKDCTNCVHGQCEGCKEYSNWEGYHE